MTVSGRAAAWLAVLCVVLALGSCGTKPGGYSTRWRLLGVDGRTLTIEVTNGEGCARPNLEVSEEPEEVTIAAIIYQERGPDCVSDGPYVACVRHRLKADLGDRRLVHAPRVRDSGDTRPQVAPGPVPDTSPRLPPPEHRRCGN